MDLEHPGAGSLEQLGHAVTGLACST
jgi:hypothetical protein